MKNLHKKQRLAHVLKVKFIWLILLVLCWFFIYYFEYKFENMAFNGLILLISSACTIRLLMSENYFISTGNWPNDIGKEETFKSYYIIHQKEAIYNKFLSTLMIVIVIFSIFLMISHLMS